MMFAAAISPGELDVDPAGTLRRLAFPASAACTALAMTTRARYGEAMRTHLFACILAAGLVTVWPSGSAKALHTGRNTAARESRVPVENASLDARDIGRGQPIIVLHGGPDFDSGYLLPDLDRLADGFRLIYYDQRGRGKSGARVQPDDVTLTSDVDDLDKVRQHFQLEAPALLGYSWGAVLALECALRHPARVSHLILMNPAPASASDLALLRRVNTGKLGADMHRQRAIMASSRMWWRRSQSVQRLLSGREGFRTAAVIAAST